MPAGAMQSVIEGLHTKVSPWALPEVDRPSRNPENWPMEVEVDQAAVVNALGVVQVTLDFLKQQPLNLLMRQIKSSA